MTHNPVREILRARAAGLRGDPFPEGATTAPATTRAHRLCQTLRQDPRGVMPADVDADLADRLLQLAVGGASLDELRAACGDTRTKNRWGATSDLRDWDLERLRALVRAAKYRLFAVAREMAALQDEHAELTDLLAPRHPAADEPTSTTSTTTD